ncbi:MAG: NAD-dependent epimerase/dehydratase family protein [Candidatus Adiutrix sp.]
MAKNNWPQITPKAQQASPNETTLCGAKCLVTGGAGFIGSHLVELLLSAGAQVRVLDDLSSGHLENLAHVLAEIDFVEGSITNEQTCLSAMRNIEYVFHLAALVSVQQSIENPKLCFELNDLGVFNIYQAAAACGVKRVVFSSSSAVYGNIDVPHQEEACPHPSSPYALHKLAGEHYGLFFHEHKHLEAVSLRYFNVYGPRQLPSSPYSGVISLFISALKQNTPISIYGDGEQTRDFIFVKDVAQANIKAALSPKASGQTFNIASGLSTTINRLYEILSTLKSGGGAKPPNFLPPRAGDIRHSSGPTKAALIALGFQAETSLAEGLGQTW